MNFLVLFSRAHWVRKEVRKLETVWRGYKERKEMGAQGISWQKLPSQPCQSYISLETRAGGRRTVLERRQQLARRQAEAVSALYGDFHKPLTRPSAAATPMSLP